MTEAEFVKEIIAIPLPGGLLRRSFGAALE